jgi:hypothetical protein
MADKFIDQDETQIYGPYASKNIRARLLGRIAAFDAALVYIADGIDASTAAVKAAVDAARAKEADRRKGTKSKAPLLEQAKRLLGRFSKHLDGHDAGAVDRKIYFTKDGTARGAGQGAQDVLLAITTITTKLADPKSPVRDAVYWHGQFDAMMKTLAPAIAYADDARADRQSLTPEVEAARQAWLNGYTAAKCVVEGVLRHLGRLDHLPLFFYDLRVPAGAKITEPPPDEPEVEAAHDEHDDDAPTP